MLENFTYFKAKEINIFFSSGIGDLVANTPVAEYIIKNNQDKIVNLLINEKQKELLPFLSLKWDNIIEIKKLTDGWKLLNKSLHFYDTSSFLKVILKPSFPNFLTYYFFGALQESGSLSTIGRRLCMQTILNLPNSLIRSTVFKYKLPLKYIVLHRFSTGKSRNFPYILWNVLLNFLTKILKLPIIELGSKNDLVHPRPTGCFKYIDLRGKTSLIESAAIIANASLFIGIDSSLAHIANALKIPGIVILGLLFGKYSKYLPYCGFYRDLKNLFVIRIPNKAPIEATYHDISPYFSKLKYWLLYRHNYPSKFYQPYDMETNKKVWNFIENNNNFILWGAGEAGLICLNYLKRLNKKVLAVIDTHKTGNINSLSIYSSSKIETEPFLKNKRILICTLNNWFEIKNYLESLGKTFYEDFL